MIISELDSFVESHLNLQVKLSYDDHHDFLVRQGLAGCSSVLDVGTGNGTFVARLAMDHPGIHFVGIDKRKHYLTSALKLKTQNLDFAQVDLFSRTTAFEFSCYDGILMRYFLLHVDNAHKILELFKMKCQRPSKFWIIDLDWSKFSCFPEHESFSKLIDLVKEFCRKISPDSQGGQNARHLLQMHGYQNIVVEKIPFSTETMPLSELVLYLKQEVQCYSFMIGRGASDPEVMEIFRFLDQEVGMGGIHISYGMSLLKAELLV